MFRVIVKNLSGNQTHGGEFQELAKAQEWANSCVAGKYWGRSYGWYKKADLSESEISEALDERTVELEFSEPEVQCLLPATFTVEIVDITEEHATRLLIQNCYKNIDKGKNILANIAAINTKKIKAGTLTEEDFEVFMEQNDVVKIERALMSGSLKTAKKKIEAMPNAHFSAEEKQLILDLFNG